MFLASISHVAIFGESFEPHEEAADHPIGDEKRHRRRGAVRNDVPTHKHAQRIVDRLSKDIKIRNVLRAHGWDVVGATRDPESGEGKNERNADKCTEAQPDDHQGNPLDVGDLDVDQTGRNRPVLLDWVVKVEWCIEHFVDHVVARGDEADRRHPDDEVLKEA